MRFIFSVCLLLSAVSLSLAVIDCLDYEHGKSVKGTDKQGCETCKLAFRVSKDTKKVDHVVYDCVKKADDCNSTGDTPKNDSTGNNNLYNYCCETSKCNYIGTNATNVKDYVKENYMEKTEEKVQEIVRNLPGGDATSTDGGATHLASILLYIFFSICSLYIV